MRNSKTIVCLFLALALSLSFLPAGFARATGELTETPEEAEASENIYSKDFDENGFFKGVKAIEHIEKFKYIGMPIPSNVHFVPEERLQAEIDMILYDFPSTEIVMDRAVEIGDLVNIDFVGSIDGVEFDGGNTQGMGTDVTAGSSDYIDNFLDQIVGHMPGETINVEVTFPEDYPAEEFSGKAAVFVTTINYITEMGAEHLTDSFVEEYLYPYYGWTTVEEMRTKLRADMREYDMKQFINEYLAYEVTVKSIPEPMIDYQVDSLVQYYQSYAEYYGMELEELLESEGYSGVDELIAEYTDAITLNATSMLVLLAVAEDAGIKVSDADIVDYFRNKNISENYLDIVEEYGMPFIKHTVLCEKVIDLIIKHAALEICVVLDGYLLSFDVQPQIVNDRTLVPFRVLAEALGATVEWEDSTKTVTVTKDDTEIVLPIGSESPTINGEAVTIDQPGIIVNNRTLVPIRFICEALGVSVSWDGGARAVIVKSY